MKPFYEQRTGRLFVGRICEIPFPLHIHKVVECVHLFEGHLRMSIDGQLYNLSPGDTVAIFPSVSHSYEEVSPDAKGLCMIFLPDTIAEFTDSFLTVRPKDPFLPASKITEGLSNAIQHLYKVSSLQQNALIKAYLHVFLAELFLLMDFESLKQQLDMNLTQRILQYISDHFREELTLESVAQDLNVSSSYLSHIFSSQLRINFRRYINMLRIDYACSLLHDTSLSVTQISYSCGFNNPRTFHRAFQEEHHMQPNEYRIQNSAKEHHQQTHFMNS